MILHDAIIKSIKMLNCLWTQDTLCILTNTRFDYFLLLINQKHEWYTVKIIMNIFQVRTALIWPNFDQIHTSCMNSFDSTYEKAYFVYISYKVTYSFWKKPKTNLKNYLKIYYPCIEDVLKWYSLTWNWIIIQIFSYIIFSYNVVQLLVF